ncbi:phosphoenolpyruvate--protein phosphotransferase [Tistlia consotensis]|uniref:Phosphoenolpyruvate-protein phosphotransferase n=1 Tax=Tistlia consotensis USBA 355 TaxID=560819 RepID=A0A1Y6CHQ5_9PROT|nr:phosphoenolpyruvate--protein phosphotransferase [Tistlia consotensis]SMF55205.1 phosphoenolpyruvate--protein phosphotransferase [Tistlia consotensis USBA 355]SNR87928.1 phosphoenolpyruvate--protein phosphotransferase [Tistlia consotensis]
MARTTEGAAETVFAGQRAAEGLAVGRLLVERAAAAEVARAAASPAEEGRAFEQALERARGQIAALVETADALGAEILEFQEALLEDDELLDPVRAAIDAGQSAAAAWIGHLDGEIETYRAGDDEYLSARAEDLADLQQRVLRALVAAGEAAGGETQPEGAILVSADLTPSRFLELDWSRLAGAAIAGGSPTSHVSILARARGVPLIVGLEADPALLPAGRLAVLDAEAARLIVEPSSATLDAVETRLARRAEESSVIAELIGRPARTAAGETVELLINVDEPGLLDSLSPESCDGIGLARTEFLFHGGRLPDEEAQRAVYRRLLDWAGGRPVTIRTLDAGGDKPIPGVTPEDEANPFLGVRGLRLSLRHPELLRVQLRALARAGADRPLKVMVPMVTAPAEFERARALFDAVLRELADEGLEHGRPPLGMMVEVPAAALTAERFACDFYSIGSNDLVQYTTACARDNPALAELADPASPAVVELIARTVAAAGRRGVEASLCGDMASDPRLVPVLLECGLRRLSVAPAQVGRVKLAIRRYGGAPE